MIGANALIGYTGFVGSNLTKQHDFDEFFNSENISLVKDRFFNLVVCAAAPGIKWQADRKPKDDFKNILKLISHLTTMNAAQFVLISTIDVFPKPRGVYEGSPTPIIRNSSYGMNRAYLEYLVSGLFRNVLIVRLPTIYSSVSDGKGLIYDIKNGNYQYVPRRGQVQIYDIANLFGDIRIALDAGLRSINIATEPIKIRKLCRHGKSKNKPMYDMHTIHAHIWGRHDNYIKDREEVLKEVNDYIKG